MRDTHKRPTRQTEEKLEFIVRNTRLEDSDAVRDVIVLANGGRLDAPWMSARSVAEQLRRFPEGQFVAVLKDGDEERVIGAATTMRTSRSPFETPLRWMEMIGSYGIANHEAHGQWLYGVEIAVLPEFRRRGVASAMYKVRLALVEKFGLEGWYAGGMLMGYHRYEDRMTQAEYYRKVVDGELNDPTVSMQMHRGLKASGFIEDYCEAPQAGNAAVLLVWQPATRARRDRQVAVTDLGARAQR